MKKQQIFLPILVLNDVSLSLEFANTLIENNIRVIEITLRTPNALEIIRRICSELPEMTVFAGTVLTTEQADRALSAGAKTLISPGYDSELVTYVLNKTGDANAIRPGVNNPTLVQHALKQGLTRLKFFPAALSGGVKMLKLLHEVYPTAYFTPTGGINIDNIKDYLSQPNIDMIGGTWVCKPERMTLQHLSAVATDIANIEQQLQKE